MGKKGIWSRDGGVSRENLLVQISPLPPQINHLLPPTNLVPVTSTHHQLLVQGGWARVRVWCAVC